MSTSQHMLRSNQPKQNVDAIWVKTRSEIQSRGYSIAAKPLTKTLQGSVWNGKNLNGSFDCKQNIVIKITNRSMHSNKITLVNGERIEVQEDIISEKEILKYLTQSGSCHGLNRFIVNYVDFFFDETNYYLVMENGGTSLFNFVTKSHSCISAGNFRSAEWQNVCKHILKQMTEFINILHNTMNVCHLDISLENILISDVKISVDSNNRDVFHMLPQFDIKFCDFGLSETFQVKSNPQFACNKFVGKIGYQSPEIFEKKRNFNAKASDIWSIGVCLFCMLFGCMPYRTPSYNDAAFQCIMKGKVFDIINKWRKADCISNCVECVDILESIFTTEDKRISGKELLAHPFCNL